MNQALDFYIGDDSVFSISGYSLNLKSLKKERFLLWKKSIVMGLNMEEGLAFRRLGSKNVYKL